MTTIDVQTSRLAPQRRFAAWQDAIITSFGPMAVTSTGSAFYGRLRSENRGTWRSHLLHYRGQQLQRSRRDVDQLDSDYYTLTCPFSGRLHVNHDNRELVLDPGHIYLFNHAVPYSGVPDSEYGTVSIAFPAAALRQRERRPRPLYVLRRDDPCQAGNVALLESFGQAFADGFSSWSETQFNCLSEQMLDLIALLVLEPTHAAQGEGDTRFRHLHRARHFIASHLHDPALTPAIVASGCGLSLSYLYEVFRAHGMSVEQHILQVRLERCYTLLRGPQYRHLSITSVAYMCGFSHPSHLSRSFRRRYGVSPRDVRASADA
jgi:AraC-like DNA-binding protein